MFQLPPDANPAANISLEGSLRIPVLAVEFDFFSTEHN
jgi:hypothetical protein